LTLFIEPNNLNKLQSKLFDIARCKLILLNKALISGIVTELKDPIASLDKKQILRFFELKIDSKNKICSMQCMAVDELSLGIEDLCNDEQVFIIGHIHETVIDVESKEPRISPVLFVEYLSSMTKQIESIKALEKDMDITQTLAQSLSNFQH
jgi:hypothetical protein